MVAEDLAPSFSSDLHEIGQEETCDIGLSVFMHFNSESLNPVALHSTFLLPHRCMVALVYTCPWSWTGRLSFEAVKMHAGRIPGWYRLSSGLSQRANTLDSLK